MDVEMKTPSDSTSDEIITLNVGGTHFQTWRSTLQKFPQTFLGKMFGQKHIGLKQQEDGSYFIDQDPTDFNCILSFYRNGVLPEPQVKCNKKWLSEVEFYGLVIPQIPHTKTIEILSEINTIVCDKVYKIMNTFFATEQWKEIQQNGEKEFNWVILSNQEITLLDGKKLKIGKHITKYKKAFLDFIKQHHRLTCEFTTRTSKLQPKSWPAILVTKDTIKMAMFMICEFVCE